MSDTPNTALQRTRSAPLRSPLSFKPFGGLKLSAWLLVALAVAASFLGCSAASSSQGAVSAWCSTDRPVDFGVQRLHGLLGTLKGKAGPIPDAAVRWRAVGVNMTTSAGWQTGGTDQYGRFFSSDLEPGKWELQLCPKGYRPIRGIVIIDGTAPTDSFDLFVERIDGRS